MNQLSIPREAGTTLQGYHWPTDLRSVKPAVLITHGLGEHALRYTDLAAWLNAKGHAVYAYDLRGHGASSGARGALPEGADLAERGFVHDLVAVLDAVSALEKTPPIVMGHSLGGLITARFVASGLRTVPACLLSSPALGLHANAFERWLIRILPRILPNLSMPNGLKVNGISHDAQVVAAYQADPLIHGKITPRLVAWMVTAIEAVQQYAPQWSVPSLLLFASDDALVRAASSEQFAQNAPAAVLSHHTIQGAYHEIFNEAAPWRGQSLDLMGAWLDGRF